MVTSATKTKVDIGLVGTCVNCGGYYFVTRRLIYTWIKAFNPSYLNVMPQFCLNCMED